MTKRSGSMDNVNHPAHYTAYKGIEVIDLTEQLNFNRGNAVKYIARAGLKDPSKEIEDLQKASWYLNREIQRIQNNEFEEKAALVEEQYQTSVKAMADYRDPVPKEGSAVLSVTKVEEHMFLAYGICEANSKIINRAIETSGLDIPHDLFNTRQYVVITSEMNNGSLILDFLTKTQFADNYEIVKTINLAVERYVVRKK